MHRSLRWVGVRLNEIGGSFLQIISIAKSDSFHADIGVVIDMHGGVEGVYSLLFCIISWYF